MGIFAADFTTTDERRAKLEATAQHENAVADQHEEILAGLAGERAHSRTHTANGHAIRWTYNADGSPAKNYCDTCKNSPCVCDFSRTHHPLCSFLKPYPAQRACNCEQIIDVSDEDGNQVGTFSDAELAARLMKQHPTHTAKPREVNLYRVDGDLYTTKCPECGECGFTVRKDGSCGFCE